MGKVPKAKVQSFWVRGKNLRCRESYLCQEFLLMIEVSETVRIRKQEMSYRDIYTVRIDSCMIRSLQHCGTLRALRPLEGLCHLRPHDCSDLRPLEGLCQ